MSVHLDIKPCLKWTCPRCERVIRVPTQRALSEIGYIQATMHLTEMHGATEFQKPFEWQVGWVKDHWGRLAAPCR